MNNFHTHGATGRTGRQALTTNCQCDSEELKALILQVVTEVLDGDAESAPGLSDDGIPMNANGALAPRSFMRSNQTGTTNGPLRPKGVMK
tara:strand:- start:331 stop:600 length:270 start_codon:yes stop_codon:yes gene_type:complete